VSRLRAAARDRRPGFYGHTIVAASFLVQAVSIGSMVSYGVFFDSVRAELGWSRATLSGAASVAFVVMGAVGVLVGRLSDRIGPRVLMAGSGVALGAGFVAMALAREPWQLYVSFGGLVGAGLSTHDVITLSTVARWFERRRGVMSGVVKVGTGCGQLAVPLIVAALIGAHGWRAASVVVGLAGGAILAFAGSFLRRDPQELGLRPDGASRSAAGAGAGSPRAVSFATAVRQAALWTLCVTQFVVFGCLLTILVHIVPHGIDLGLSKPAAASVLSAIGGFSIIGRLTVGGMVDRIGGRRSLVMCFIVLFLSFAWLTFATDAWMLFVFAAVYGFAHGGFFTVMAPTVAELFGTAAHGALFGAVLFFGDVGGAIGPWLAGRGFDLTGSYQPAFVALAIAAALGLVLVTRLPRREAGPRPGAGTGAPV
jgi:MFS family permease